MLLFRNILSLAVLFLTSYGSLQAAPPWAPPHQFPVVDGQGVHVGTDANGNAMALWDDSSAGTVINASYFTGGAWGPSVTVSPLGDTTFGSQLAMDASGTALAIWINQSDSSIESATFNGTTWTAPTVVFNASPAFSPMIAMDGTGRGVAAWNDAANQIFSALYNGVSWEAPVLIGTSASNQEVAISPTGTALAVWSDFTDIFSAFYNGSAWEPQTIISTGVGNRQPSIGMTATGTGLAVWTNFTDIFAASFDGASWGAPIVISTGVGNSDPEIAVQPNGLATAVWEGAGGTIQSASFNGTTWLPPTLVTTSTPSELPSVSMDGNGNAIAIWVYIPDESVQSALLRAGQTIWETPLIIDIPPGLIGETEVAFSSSGRAFAVWSYLTSEETVLSFGSFLDAAIPPPTGFTGIACTDRFGWQRDCVNILSWNPPESEVVASFRLRRNGVLIAQLPAIGPYRYVDHNRCRRTDVYTLTSVDIFGIESLPVSVTLQ